LIAENYKNLLNWIGIINWIPYIWLFWALQPYLSFQINRKIFIKYLLIGSVPVLIMGLLQFFLNIHGPFVFLKGLIVWFQYKLEGDMGLSSIFANANNAAAWFSAILPLSIVFLYKNKSNNFLKIPTFIFVMLIIISMILTNSRGAWVTLFIPIFFLLKGLRKYFYVILFLAVIPLIINYLPFIPENIQEFTNRIIPGRILRNIDIIDYKEPLSNLYRVQIWITSIGLVLQKPFLGWGAGSLPILYMQKHDLFIYHTHNLPLELAFNYGLLSSLLIFMPLFYLLFITYKLIFKKNGNFLTYDKAWWVSTFSIFALQMFDVQYYSARISLIFWLLIIGLKSYLNELDKETKLIINK
tara:strand:- start:45758 stop:46822 length:1065 start_codon:yes stop_codon:yes gene_type:complete